MKETKTCLKWFDITQYEKEAEFLRNMHKKGWKIVSVSFPGKYHFEKCQPEDVVYQLDYNQEGIDHKSEYVQLFQDCGWEYLFDFVGYSYFRKPVSEMDGEESIFCDEQSRLDMLNRVYKGRVIPLVVIFFCCLVPQFINNTVGYGGGGSVQRALAIALGTILVVYIIFFIRFGLGYMKLKKRIYK